MCNHQKKAQWINNNIIILLFVKRASLKLYLYSQWEVISSLLVYDHCKTHSAIIVAMETIEGNLTIVNGTDEVLIFWQNRVSLSLFTDVLMFNNSIGFIGNCFIMFVLLFNKTKITSTNIYLLNLALSDFGYTSTILIRGLSFYYTDIALLHPWLCKLW